MKKRLARLRLHWWLTRMAARLDVPGYPWHVRLLDTLAGLVAPRP